MTTKRLTAMGCIFLLCAGISAEGFKFRAILDNNYIGYSDDQYLFKSENVLLFYAHPAFIPTARIIVSKTSQETRTLVQPGLVWIIKDGLYGEFAYGVSTAGSGPFAQEGFAEISHETEDTLATGRIRGGLDHETDIFFLIPDVSFRNRFNRLYAAKLHYFFGYNTDSFTSHSLQLENVFTIRKACSAAFIATALRESSDSGTDNLWSAGLRLQGLIAGRWNLKYLIQYHALADERWGLENGITLDWNF
jgi:hypothetical protein